VEPAAPRQKPHQSIIHGLLQWHTVCFGDGKQVFSRRKGRKVEAASWRGHLEVLQPLDPLLTSRNMKRFMFRDVSRALLPFGNREECPASVLLTQKSSSSRVGCPDSCHHGTMTLRRFCKPPIIKSLSRGGAFYSLYSLCGASWSILAADGDASWSIGASLLLGAPSRRRRLSHGHCTPFLTDSVTGRLSPSFVHHGGVPVKVLQFLQCSICSWCPFLNSVYEREMSTINIAWDEISAEKYYF